MKELDLLLERFLEDHYDRAPPERQRAFERLLALPDPLLAELLLGAPPDASAAHAPGARPDFPGPFDAHLAEVLALVATSVPR